MTEPLGTISIDVYYSAWIGIACAAHWACCEALEGVVGDLRVPDNRMIGLRVATFQPSVRLRNEKRNLQHIFLCAVKRIKTVHGSGKFEAEVGSLQNHYISFLKDKNNRTSSMYLPTLLLSKLAESLCDKYVTEDQDPSITGRHQFSRISA